MKKWDNGKSFNMVALGAEKKPMTTDVTGLDRQWAGLDSNQRRLTPMGLQSIDKDSQGQVNKELMQSPCPCLQASLQECSECLQNALPSELFELISVWDDLPEHVRQTIQMLVESAK